MSPHDARWNCIHRLTFRHGRFWRVGRAVFVFLAARQVFLALLAAPLLLACLLAPTAAQSQPAMPTVTIAGSGKTVFEGADATFTLTASPAPSAPVTVNVNVAEFRRIAGDGQTGLRKVTIGTNGTGRLTVTTVDDDMYSGYGTSISATVQAGDGYAVGRPSWGAVIVYDDDYTSLLRLAVSGTVLHPSEIITEGQKLAFLFRVGRAPRTSLPVKAKFVRTGDFIRSYPIHPSWTGQHRDFLMWLRGDVTG